MDTAHSWFDYYDGQAVVVVDDVNPANFSSNLFLRTADRYPLRLPVKGGFTTFNAKLMVFTSNIAYDAWWANQAHPGAINRRVCQSYYMREVNNQPVLTTVHSSGCQSGLMHRFVIPTDQRDDDAIDRWGRLIQ